LYQAQYRESVNSDIDKLRERVSFEYVFYNNNTKSLSVYLMNSGKVDNVNFTTVYIRDFSSSSPIATFTSDHFQLTFLNPPQQPTHDLDMGEEGRILLDLSLVTLQSGNAYTVKVETRRSSYFESMFKA
jgi:hypothetical protein